DMIVYNGALYFDGITSSSGPELFKTDGSVGGTRLAVKVNPAPGIGSYPYHYQVVNGRLVFQVGFTNPYHLYSTDGTAAGTFGVFTGGPSNYTPNIYYLGV